MLQRQSMITKSLRAAHSEINIPESIFGDSNYAPSIYGETSTIFTAAEFEFDDTIINSKAYRRALAVARFKSSSSEPSIQADLKAEKSNADSSSPRVETNAEQREEGQNPSLERSLSEQIIDFDLIDLNFDSDVAQAVNIAPSLENSWGLSEVMSQTTLDKPPEFALTEKPSSGMTVLSPQLRPTERITKNFNGPRPTSWPPHRPSRPLGTPHVSSFSKFKSTPDASPGLPVKPTPSIIKFNKHTHANQNTNVFLYNPNDRPILFKIKTTAPKRYSVGPRTVGRIEPGEFLTVNIRLEGLPKAGQELKSSEHPGYRDKFLIQSYTIPGETVPDWGTNFDNRKHAEVKIRVQFRKEEPVEEGVAPNQRARAGSL